MVVLDRVLGEGNKVLFVGFTDLFQQIIDALIPNFWPFTVLEDIFNQTFDMLQEQMKPFAYEQGAAMGKDIEEQVEKWIRSQFDTAMSELLKVKNEALGEIKKAQQELIEHAGKISNLLERVAALEGTSKEEHTNILNRRVI